MKRSILSIVIALTALCACAKREATPVYIVAGQSNTDGRAQNKDLPDYIQQNKYKHCYWSYGSAELSGKGQFELFWPRINNKNNPNRWAYDAVVNYWLEQSLGRDFYVIKESLGGTAIDPSCPSTNKMYWSADPAFLDSTKAADKGGKSLLKAFTENIGACIDNKLSKLKGGYEIKAFIWHQGESDRHQAGKYYKNLKGVVTYVRQYLVKKTGNKKYADLPVIIGGIVFSGRGHHNSVAEAQIQLTREDKNVHYVEVHDATLQSDNMHFDAAGTEMLGRKIYNQLVELNLAGKNAKPVPYNQKTRVYKVGDGGAFVFASFPEQKTDSMRAVVACPGGGYGHLALYHEGTAWEKFFNDRGIAYFTLVYRMPKGDRTIPMGDAEAAIKLVRDSAEAWHIDPHNIGIMGSSAGGHLASTVATHADSASRPDFQILFYPVITFVNDTHNGTWTNFLGKQKNDTEMRRLYSGELQVNANTPPAIILLASDDRAVPALTNGVAYYEALVKAGVKASLHCYPDGGHGFGYNTTFKYHDAVITDLSEWLK